MPFTWGKLWPAVPLIWGASSAAVPWPRLTAVPEARESPVKCSVPFPPSSHDLFQMDCFWRKPATPQNWSERTYSLATHKGEEIHSPTFFRNHHPGKAVTPVKARTRCRALDLGCTCAAARKRSCPHFIHTNIHMAAQKAGPVLWADFPLCTNTKDQPEIISTARSSLGLSLHYRGQGSPWKITKGKSGLKLETNCRNKSVFGEATKGWTPL